MQLLTAACFIFCSCTLIAAETHGAQHESAEDILQKVDEVRAPTGNYILESLLTSVKNTEKSYFKAQVLISGPTKTLTQILEPAIERKVTLRVEKALWIMTPHISRPIRIALGQRLAGVVSYADMARTHFSGWYLPKLVQANNAQYLLELTGKDGDEPYSKIMLWVQRGNYHPIKAEFYAASGRHLKTCLYEDYKMLAGRLRPAKMIYTETTDRNRLTVIELHRAEPHDLQKKFFNKDNLKTLRLNGQPLIDLSGR
ncbi:MAG: outer membrane lipoprotein-sorting protein [Elusimicrobia bacterium]|nr:outer membrane lipoprotein-sorting protein [Elusimicrobiota bacterium]